MHFFSSFPCCIYLWLWQYITSNSTCLDLTLFTDVGPCHKPLKVQIYHIHCFPPFTVLVTSWGIRTPRFLWTQTLFNVSPFKNDFVFFAKRMIPSFPHCILGVMPFSFHLICLYPSETTLCPVHCPHRRLALYLQKPGSLTLNAFIQIFDRNCEQRDPALIFMNPPTSQSLPARNWPVYFFLSMCSCQPVPTPAPGPLI